MWFAVFSQNDGISTKKDQRKILQNFMFFVDHFNTVQLSILVLCKIYHSILLAWWILSFRCCKFFGFDGRYLFTIMRSHGVSAASRARRVFFKKKTWIFSTSRVGIDCGVSQRKMCSANSSFPPNLTFISTRTIRSLSIFRIYLIWKHLVKVNKGSAPSVLDYKACQESLFPFLEDFHILVYGNRNWYFYCIAKKDLWFCMWVMVY